MRIRVHEDDGKAGDRALSFQVSQLSARRFDIERLLNDIGLTVRTLNNLKVGHSSLICFLMRVQGAQTPTLNFNDTLVDRSRRLDLKVKNLGPGHVADLKGVLEAS